MSLSLSCTFLHVLKFISNSDSSTIHPSFEGFHSSTKGNILPYYARSLSGHFSQDQRLNLINSIQPHHPSLQMTLTLNTIFPTSSFIFTRAGGEIERGRVASATHLIKIADGEHTHPCTTQLSNHYCCQARLRRSGHESRSSRS